jgi:hypothetical protein
MQLILEFEINDATYDGIEAARARYNVDKSPEDPVYETPGEYMGFVISRAFESYKNQYDIKKENYDANGNIIGEDGSE